MGPCFLTGGSCFREGFHAFEEVHIFRKRGFTFMKIVLSAYYWAFTVLRKGFTILEKGVHIYEK